MVDRGGGGTLCDGGCLGRSVGGRETRVCDREVSAFAGSGEGEGAAATSVAVGEGGIQSSSSVHSDIAGEADGERAGAGGDFLRRTSRMIGTRITAPSTPTIVKISTGSISLPASCCLSSVGAVAGGSCGLACGVDCGSAFAVEGVSGGTSAWGAAGFFKTDKRGPPARGKEEGALSVGEAVEGAG